MNYYPKFLLAGILSISASTIAQDSLPPIENPYENWYQVEILVFKRSETASAYDKEAWPKNLALAYPPNVQHLIDPNAASENAEEIDNKQANNQASIASGMPASEHQTSLIAPFELLDKTHFFIENARSAIRRERGVKILFHETWLQPILALDDAPAVLIKGGENFGEHAELEGSITLSLSRYLHIHTDLWLTSFVANYGQQDEHWPDLPTQPRPVDLSDLGTGEVKLDNPLSRLSETNTGFELSFEQNEQNLQAQNTESFTDYSKLTERPYLINEIITLTQKRRMRSEELHYIDHPRMGILIKIAGYDGPGQQQASN